MGMFDWIRREKCDTWRETVTTEQPKPAATRERARKPAKSARVSPRAADDLAVNVLRSMTREPGEQLHLQEVGRKLEIEIVNSILPVPAVRSKDALARWHRKVRRNRSHALRRLESAGLIRIDGQYLVVVDLDCEPASAKPSQHKNNHEKIEDLEQQAPRGLLNELLPVHFPPVQCGIPMPERFKRQLRPISAEGEDLWSLQAMRSMGVGDSVFVPRTGKTDLRAMQMNMAGTLRGTESSRKYFRFATSQRVEYGIEGIRVWRVQ